VSHRSYGPCRYGQPSKGHEKPSWTLDVADHGVQKRDSSHTKEERGNLKCVIRLIPRHEDGDTLIGPQGRSDQRADPTQNQKLPPIHVETLDR
jgi:hypothetical protein